MCVHQREMKKKIETYFAYLVLNRIAYKFIYGPATPAFSFSVSQLSSTYIGFSSHLMISCLKFSNIIIDYDYYNPFSYKNNIFPFGGGGGGGGIHIEEKNRKNNGRYSSNPHHISFKITSFFLVR